MGLEGHWPLGEVDAPFVLVRIREVSHFRYVVWCLYFHLFAARFRDTDSSCTAKVIGVTDLEC